MESVRSLASEYLIMRAHSTGIVYQIACAAAMVRFSRLWQGGSEIWRSALSHDAV